MARMMKELGTNLNLGAISVTAISTTSISYSRAGTSSTLTCVPGAHGVVTLDGATLLDQVAACTFTYYKADGSTAAAAADVQAVKVGITMSGANGQLLPFTNQISIKESFD